MEKQEIYSKLTKRFLRLDKGEWCNYANESYTPAYIEANPEVFDCKPYVDLGGSWSADNYSLADIARAAEEAGYNLKEIRISAENIKERGCGCHPEASDYSLYLRIYRNETTAKAY